MDMMMNMFAGNDGGDRVTLFCATLNALVLELSTLLLETGLDGFRVTVVELAMLYGDDVVFVSLRKYFTVLDGLNGSMEMVLVHFAIDGGLSLFVTVFLDGLLGDGGSNSLVDGCIMVTSLVPVQKDSQHRSR